MYHFESRILSIKHLMRSINDAFWRINGTDQQENTMEFVQVFSEEEDGLHHCFLRINMNLAPLLTCPKLSDEEKALVRKYQQERDALRHQFHNCIDIQNFVANLVGNG